MQLITAFVIALMFACSVYLILRSSLIKILFGICLLNHAVNLVVLAVAGSPLGKQAPIVSHIKNNYVDPLPQALILTAIVISLGITALVIVFLYRLFIKHKTACGEVILKNDNQ